MSEERAERFRWMANQRVGRLEAVAEAARRAVAAFAEVDPFGDNRLTASAALDGLRAALAQLETT